MSSSQAQDSDILFLPPYPHKILDSFGSLGIEIETLPRKSPKYTADNARGERMPHTAAAAAGFFAELIGKLAKWFCWSGANSFTRLGSRTNNNAITIYYNGAAFVDWTSRLLLLLLLCCVVKSLSNSITL